MDINKKVAISRLLDLYGALLTDNQRAVVDMANNMDMSLAEIAAETGASRQAVHESLQRAEQALLTFETKLGFMARLKALNIEH